MAEDDFHRWEREFEAGEAGEAGEGRSGSRGLVLVCVIITTGCAALIVLGDVPLGAAGLVLSSIVLLLWRIGM